MSAQSVVNEIYLSVQGESSWSGTPCVFIRLTGCDLRCSYCDTAYAFGAGERMSLDSVIAEVEALAKPYRHRRLESAGVALPIAEITGGEPLLQNSTPELARRLCDAGFLSLIETNGARDISKLDPRVRRIVDLKTPSSGESARMDWNNVENLRATDEVKFVIATREDFEWSANAIREWGLADRCLILFSWVERLRPEQRVDSLKPEPSDADRIPRQELVERMIAENIPARFQLQAHKYIWSPDQRGV